MGHRHAGPLRRAGPDLADRDRGAPGRPQRVL